MFDTHAYMHSRAAGRLGSDTRYPWVGYSPAYLQEGSASRQVWDTRAGFLCVAVVGFGWGYMRPVLIQLRPITSSYLFSSYTGWWQAGLNSGRVAPHHIRYVVSTAWSQFMWSSVRDNSSCSACLAPAAEMGPLLVYDIEVETT